MKIGQDITQIDELRRSIESAVGGNVKTIVDYTDESLIVVMNDPNVTPGRLYRINKNTGDASIFVPTMDLEGYFEAVERRSVTFDD